MEYSEKERIDRYCEGRLSGDEEMELLEWARKSSENEEKFRAAENGWNAKHVRSMQATIAIAKAQSRAGRAKNRSRIVAYISGIAAAAVLACVLVSDPFRHEALVGGSPVSQNVCINVPMSSITDVILPDGTKVTLNSGSSINYGRNFNKKNRDIFLHGEAYFEVVKNESMPFVVHTDKCDITVLGTRFDVYAYEDEDVAYAALMEGSLKMDAGSATILISPDEVVSYDGSSITKTITETDQYLSWISGEIKYDEIGLSEFLHRISRLYDIPVSYSGSGLDSRKFRAAFTKRDSMEQVLEAVSNLLPIKVTETGEGYDVSNI